MEMHSQASLYEIHGLSVVRRRGRSRPIVRRLVAGILAFVAISRGRGSRMSFTEAPATAIPRPLGALEKLF